MTSFARLLHCRTTRPAPTDSFQLILQRMINENPHFRCMMSPVGYNVSSLLSARRQAPVCVAMCCITRCVGLTPVRCPFMQLPGELLQGEPHVQHRQMTRKFEFVSYQRPLPGYIVGGACCCPPCGAGITSLEPWAAALAACHQPALLTLFPLCCRALPFWTFAPST
jgi:hypothetical protein